jgi:serine protease Do
MQRHRTRIAVAVAFLTVVGGAGTEARAQYNRRTPIVEAVEKTRAGIVAVKAEKDGGWGHKEIVGTGVIVDERGYLITNNHVAGGAESITVCLSDGTRLAGRVVMADANHDLAVVRIRAERKLQALRLGPSSDLLVGETVIAVGHPYGYNYSVSTGIVSAVGREITMPSGATLENLIQTNASINPGNSGGPLLNINGEVIGINVAVREGAQGIAFALNADAVQQFLSRAFSAERVAGVRHGLSCRESVAADGSEREHVVVSEVADEGPAATAGVRPGDEIVKVADRPVANRFDVERALWSCQNGDKVSVTIRRQGHERVVAVRLVGAQGDDHVASARSGE